MSHGLRRWAEPPWVRDPLYILAGQLPAVDWRFAQDRSLVDRIRGLALTFTRTTGRTFVDADGSTGSVGVNVPAFSYSGGVSRGLDVWEARTNIWLDSGTPATRSVTLTAAAHTLSFKGTGTLTLTGASTAGPLVGTGANNRVSLTFTPSAGSVTFTLSGSISEPQLELGANASPYIATAGSTVQRTADVCNTTDLSWFNASGGVFYTELAFDAQQSNPRYAFSADDGTNNNRAQQFIGGINSMNHRTILSTVGYNPGAAFIGAALTVKTANAFRVGSSSEAATAGVASSPSASPLPSALTATNTLRAGAGPFGEHANGTIARLAYFPPGPAAQRLQGLTA